MEFGQGKLAVQLCLSRPSQLSDFDLANLVSTSLPRPRWAPVPKTFATEVTTSIRVCRCERWTNTFCFSSPLTSVHIGEPAYYTPSCRSPTFVPPLGWLDSPGWGPTASTEHRTAKSRGGNPELSLVDFRRSRLHLDGGKNTSDGVDGLPLVLDYVETQNTICVYCTRWRKGQQRMH